MSENTTVELSKAQESQEYPAPGDCSADQLTPQSSSIDGNKSDLQPAETACGSPAHLRVRMSSQPIADTVIWRLKVVGIPEGYTEDQLRSLFSLCGTVCEARIVIDKASGRQVGYGYVAFSTKEAADLAISTFDDQLQLQGAANTLSVYYAKKQHDNAVIQDKESCPARNAKLYFCGTPSSFRRDSILALFSAFGRVRHLQVYTDSFGVLASGTVTMYSTEEATAAMNSLDGKVLQPGTAPLKVTWAQLSTLPRRNPAGGGPPPPMPKGFTVSYACLPTFVTPSEIAALFERFGMVLQVVPFAHRREGPQNSRGCGLVVIESEQSGMAAMEALSGKFTWPGAERPLLVQPFYGVERIGPHQLPTLPEGPPACAGSSSNYSSQGGGSGGRLWTPGVSYSNPNRGYGSYRDDSNRRGPSMVVPAAEYEPPPPSCAPDAFKIVLANVPNGYLQSDVSALLGPYGQVMSVFREQSRDPNGDGTVSVWYQTGAQAEAAVAGLRNVVLMAAGGPRKLVVRACRGRGSQQQGMRQAMGGQYQLGHGGCNGGSGSLDSPERSAGYHHVVINQPAPQVAQYAYTSGMAQQGLQLVTPGQQALDSSQVVWQGGAVSAPAVSSAAAITMQLAGGPLGQLSNNRGGALDMQQLMYMLPPQQQQQPQAAMTGQLWNNTAAPQMMVAGQQGQLSSGNMLEQLQMGSDASTATNYMAANVPTVPAASAPVVMPGGGNGYTGWLL